MKAFRMPRSRSVLSLFLEATRLKTERTTDVVIRVDPAGVEAQVVGVGTRRNGRRPAVPVAADAIQRTSSIASSSTAVAEARSRVF